MRCCYLVWLDIGRAEGEICWHLSACFASMKLAKELKQYLQKAEKKIKIISKNNEEAEVLEENLGRKIDK